MGMTFGYSAVRFGQTDCRHSGSDYNHSGSNSGHDFRTFAVGGPKSDGHLAIMFRLHQFIHKISALLLRHGFCRNGDYVLTPVADKICSEWSTYRRSRSGAAEIQRDISSGCGGVGGSVVANPPAATLTDGEYRHTGELCLKVGERRSRCKIPCRKIHPEHASGRLANSSNRFTGIDICSFFHKKRRHSTGNRRYNTSCSSSRAICRRRTRECRTRGNQFGLRSQPLAIQIRNTIHLCLRALQFGKGCLVRITAAHGSSFHYCYLRSGSHLGARLHPIHKMHDSGSRSRRYCIIRSALLHSSGGFHNSMKLAWPNGVDCYSEAR